MQFIRQANIKDVFAIHELSEHLGYKMGPVSDTHDRLSALLASANDDVKVFVEGQSDSEVILGWVHMFKALRLASAPFYELGGLVVNPDSRRQGIGKALVVACSDQAREENMTLRVRCNETRKDTHEFYRRLNFSQTKTQFVFVSGTD